MTMPLMKCGHVAQGRNWNNDPVCVICAGINDDFDQVETAPINLTGRMAHCAYTTCKSMQESSLSLPFFTHHPDKQYDTYYCGCLGWN